MKECKHRKTIRKHDVRLDRKVITERCKNCLLVISIIDNGHYEGTPRPIPITIRNI